MQMKCLSMIAMLVVVVAVAAYGRDCGQITVTGGDTSAWQDCVTATGLVIQNNPYIQSPSFPNLVVINGQLQISGNTALTSVIFDKLEAVLSYFAIFNNPYLTTVSMPKFAYASAMNFGNSDAFETLSMPLLTFTNALTFENVHLPIISLQSLSSTFGYIAVRNCPYVSSISLPSLGSTGGLDFEDDPNLYYVNIPQISSVQYDVKFQGSVALQTLTLPVVSIGSNLNIQSNSALTTLSLQYLNSVGGAITIQPIPQTIYSCLPALEAPPYNAVCAAAQAKKKETLTPFSQLTAKLNKK